MDGDVMEDETKELVDAVTLLWQVAQSAAQPAQVHIECQMARNKLIAHLLPDQKPDESGEALVESEEPEKKQ